MRQVAVFAMALWAVSTLHAQSAVIRSVGQYEPSGTVLYSVYAASRTQPLGDVAISSLLPPGTRFLESVDLPRAARYEGVADNTIVWTIPEIAADTVAGPFTFRLKVDGARTTVPTALASTLIYQRPTPEVVQAPASTEVLAPLADSGSITFDQRGTLTSSGENGPAPLVAPASCSSFRKGRFRSELPSRSRARISTTPRCPRSMTLGGAPTIRRLSSRDPPSPSP